MNNAASGYQRSGSRGRDDHVLHGVRRPRRANRIAVFEAIREDDGAADHRGAGTRAAVYAFCDAIGGARGGEGARVIDGAIGARVALVKGRIKNAVLF